MLCQNEVGKEVQVRIGSGNGLGRFALAAALERLSQRIFKREELSHQHLKDNASASAWGDVPNDTVPSDGSENNGRRLVLAGDGMVHSGYPGRLLQPTIGFYLAQAEEVKADSKGRGRLDP